MVYTVTTNNREFVLSLIQQAEEDTRQIAAEKLANGDVNRVRVRQLTPQDIGFPSSTAPGYDVSFDASPKEFTLTLEERKVYTIIGFRTFARDNSRVVSIRFTVAGIEKPKLIVHEARLDPQGTVYFSAPLKIRDWTAEVKVEFEVEGTPVTERIEFVGFVGEAKPEAQS